jgi:hypothetical protein
MAHPTSSILTIVKVIMSPYGSAIVVFSGAKSPSLIVALLHKTTVRDKKQGLSRLRRPARESDGSFSITLVLLAERKSI